MTSYLYQAPSGVVGDITRVSESVVEPAMLVAPFPANYGVAMKNATGGVTPFGGSDTAPAFAGMLTRHAPGISHSSVGESVGTFQPNQAEAQNLMTHGYCCVNCKQGTPVRGAAVYIRITADTGKAVGDLETAADSGKCIPLTGTLVGNVTWAVDGKDASGNAEIRIAQ